MIREDLSSRPHTLVGSAALATETGQIPIVTQRSTERRAAMMLTHKAPPSDTAGDEEDEDSPRPRRRWLFPAALALMALILAAVLALGYVWTQTRYYVATFDNRVAIYNGVAQTLGPIPLSHVDQTTDIPVSSLPQFQRNRLENTLAARDLEHAQNIVQDLRRSLRALPCPPESDPSPSASPSPSSSASAGSASPEPSASPSRGASAEPSPSATADPTPSASASASATATASASENAEPGEPAVCGGIIQ